MIRATPLYPPHPAQGYPESATVYLLSAPIRERMFAIAWREENGRWAADVCGSIGERHGHAWPVSLNASESEALATLGACYRVVRQLEFEFDG